jgi:uncharacterized lipoprotein YajG
MKNIVKKILCVGGVAVFLFAAKAWGGGEHASITLKLPPDFVAKTCPATVWKGKTVLWKGVTDARPEPAIGGQSKKKGKDPIMVDSNPPLDSFLNTTLQNLLSACGMKITGENKPDVTMSAEIREFYAGVEKGFFTGKGVARSALLFHVNKKNDTTERTVEVGYEMEAKKIRQKDIRQLESTLNDLLARTLEQVPKLDGLKDL